MEKTIFLVLILLLTICTTPAHSSYYSESEPQNPPKIIKTRLRFYLHDTLSGKNPTAVQIAAPQKSDNKIYPMPFGTLFAIDEPLTEGPSLDSGVVGNAQGMYLSSSQVNDLTLVMYVDLGFTTGKFNGSSLSVFSRSPVTLYLPEMAVVGGRGLFRMAQGTVLATTYALNKTTGNAIFEYNVEVYHPER